MTTSGSDINMSGLSLAINGLDDMQKGISSDYLQFGEFLPLNSVGNFKKGDHFQVLVSDVISPLEFWVQIYDPHSKALAKMMADMKEQYDNCDTVQMPPSMLPVRGLQFCVIKTNEIWYRAVVIGEPTSNGNVKIRHVDFGTVAIVHITDLRPLRRQWAVLPMQALRSKLTKLISGGDEAAWTPEQTAFFSNMVCGAPLIAMVTAVDTVVNTLHLYLLDPAAGLYANKHLHEVHNSLVQPNISSFQPLGLSPFLLCSLPDLPFKDLPLWRHDCLMFLELNKTEPQNAMKFITMKIEEIMQIAYAVI